MAPEKLVPKARHTPVAAKQRVEREAERRQAYEAWRLENEKKPKAKEKVKPGDPHGPAVVIMDPHANRVLRRPVGTLIVPEYTLAGGGPDDDEKKLRSPVDAALGSRI